MAAWASLSLIVVHGIGAWLAFGGATPRFPIADPFIRWELLNAEFCFTTLVAVTSVLAIRTRIPTPFVALAALWSAQTAFVLVWPIPLPADLQWLNVVAVAAPAVLAVWCWIAARGSAR
jgi:uncharacterized membrane protein